MGGRTAAPVRVDLAERRLEPEWMDQPGLDPSLHHAALRGLSRINRLSRSAEALWSELRAHPVKRVLDVACGGGDVTVALSRLAREAHPAARVDGCDISEVALQHARAAAETAGEPCAFMRLDVLRDALPGGYDAIVSSLFLHHLETEDVRTLLRRMAEAAPRVLINDLERGPVGYAMARIGTRLLSGSAVVHVDGPRSVRAAFTAPELREISASAGLIGVRVRRVWPCRMILSWNRT
jgi:2-polyprenyl-3-methyl-5-hydroxy-6-metoxy-1,4-benzoquinol methylase